MDCAATFKNRRGVRDCNSDIDYYHDHEKEKMKLKNNTR
jgi:hypothetical protein